MLVAAIGLFVAANLRSPYLLAVRDLAFAITAASGFLAGVCLILQRKRILTQPIWQHRTGCRSAKFPAAPRRGSC